MKAAPQERVDTEQPAEKFGVSKFQRREPLNDEEYRRFREEYGYLRAFFKARPQRYARVQHGLNQSHMGTTYDAYLTRSVWYAFAAGLLGAVLGTLFTVSLSWLGLLAGLGSPIPVSGGLATFVGSHRVYFVGAALALVGGSLFAGGVWTGRYYYPLIRRSLRRQEIDVVLPHGIVFMYAMRHGGTSLFETFRALADAGESYGEVSDEFEMIVNDMELFGTDMHTAIRNARRLTPSSRLERFFDDLLSVLESGGDVTVFLEEETETYLRESREEQENFLDTISLMAEIFVVLFVAAPVFIIVTLVVIDILGGSGFNLVLFLVYGAMPLAMAGFIILLDQLGRPFEPPKSNTAVTLENPAVEGKKGADERFDDYRSNRRKESFRDEFQTIGATLRSKPVYTMVVTIPLAAVVFAIQMLFGGQMTNLDGVSTSPVATTLLFLVPVLIVAVPLAFFHEHKRRRERQIAHDFPETLNVLASANKMGIPFTESLEVISQWSGGIIGQELRTIRNDIVWNYDVRRAMLGFGNRASVPRISRTMKLLAEGIYTTGDLSKVLEIAASDTRDRDEMERARHNELSTYIVVVVIGFLVYLLVIVLLDVGFLQTLPQVEGEHTAESGALITSFQNVPVETYRAVFFHSVLIQAFGTGLLAGKLSDNNALSGLKYGIALSLVALGVFLFI